MKTLYLLRHAKSDWDNAGLDDFERPLNKRGQRAAQQMRAYFAKHKVQPQLVLCSTARRTQATWELVRSAINPPPRFKALESLYLAPPSRILTILQRLPDECTAAMVIGHNPGIAQVASLLAREGRSLNRLREKYPTGALAVLTLDIANWSEVRGGRGHLVSFTAPDDLEERVD